MTIIAYAAHDASPPLVPFTIERRESSPQDIEIDILELIPMASINGA